SIGTVNLCLSHYTKTGFGATDISCTACQLLAILAQKPTSGSPFHSRVCASGIRGEGHFSATLILLFCTPGYGDGADEVAALHDGHRAPTRHDAAYSYHSHDLQ